MNKFFIVFIVGSMFLSCNEKVEPPQQETVSPKEQLLAKATTFDEKLAIELQTELRLEANEKIDTAIYFEQLNEDGEMDAIVTVNLLNRAIKEASVSEKTAKLAETNYLGKYNYIFIYNGAAKKFNKPYMLSSSATNPLKVHFENLESVIFKTAIVEYRIMNAGFWSFFKMQEAQTKLLFNCQTFDSLGTTSPKSYAYEYQSTARSAFSDILIYKGKIKNYSVAASSNHVKYSPEIEPTTDLIYHFFYDPQRAAYVIPANTKQR